MVVAQSIYALMLELLPAITLTTRGTSIFDHFLIKTNFPVAAVCRMDLTDYDFIMLGLNLNHKKFSNPNKLTIKQDIEAMQENLSMVNNKK